MLWLRRNLLLAVGGLVALLLLGGGSWYLWTSRKRNSEVETALQEKRQALEQIYNDNKSPFPSKTNITAAKGELQKARAVIQAAKVYFSPILAPKISGPEFRSLLDTAVFDLRKRAEAQGIGLPGRDYAFSFEAQRKKLTFGEGTFPAMPQQLAEIYALCGVLFESQINKLVGVRRTRVSSDDEASKGAPDYHELGIQTNAVTKCVSSPYQLEFHCFSEELSRVMRRLQESTNGLTMKSLLIEPLAATAADATATSSTALGTPGAPPPPVAPQPPVPGAPRPVAARPPPPDPYGKTILDERLLKVTFMVEVIRCAQ